MKRLNEDGNTLVLVLLTITLISVFATVLSAQAITGTKQVKQTESHIKATDAAEMGIDHFYEAMKDVFASELIYNNPCTSGVETKAQNLISDVQGAEGEFYNKQVDSQTYYTISNFECKYSDTSKKYEFSFTSEGKITLENEMNSVTKPVNANFPIYIGNMFPAMPNFFETCKQTGTPSCSPSSNTTYIEDVHFPGSLDIYNKSVIEAQKSIYIDQDLIVKGYNSITELDVGNDAFVKGDIELNEQADVKIGNDLHLNGTFTEGNLADIVIYGDAYFYESFSTKPNSLVCVQGTLTHHPESTFPYTLLANEPLLADKPKTCDQILQLNKNISSGSGGGAELSGIYATEVVPFPPSDISINDNDLNVEY